MVNEEKAKKKVDKLVKKLENEMLAEEHQKENSKQMIEDLIAKDTAEFHKIEKPTLEQRNKYIDIQIKRLKMLDTIKMGVMDRIRVKGAISILERTRKTEVRK